MNEPNPTTDELAMFLENEAAKILEIAACFEEDGSKVAKPYAQAAARLRELEADKSRLDWVNKVKPSLDKCRGKFYVGNLLRNGSIDDGCKDLRDAIDAARAR